MLYYLLISALTITFSNLLHFINCIANLLDFLNLLFLVMKYIPCFISRIRLRKVSESG